MICIECGGAVFGSGELCEDCMDMNGIVGGNVSLQDTAASSSADSCVVCNLNATAMNSRTCSSCNKPVHKTCDSSEINLQGFVCIQCRRTPLDADVNAMLNPSSNDPISPLTDPSNPFSAPMFSNIPSHSNDFVEAYQPHHPHPNHLPDELISDSVTNDGSAQHSPFYAAESSDYDEDFVPGTGRGRGRGSGAKKKPGRGQSLLKKQQQTTALPQTGFYSPAQLAAITQPSTRGKRGKRGSTTAKQPGKGGGRGRGRGRGSANSITQVSMGAAMMNAMQTPAVFHQAASMMPIQNPVYQPISHSISAIREIDENTMEDESSRQSAATRADDAEYVRTVVVCSSNDLFLKKVCLCLICGAVGKGAESSMVACSNCAQTYHTYCVGLHEKLNSTVIFRGWRCLDCTVCEGCGNGGDESKLLLCEECDVSYHIYCLKPPLDLIPTGPWRCQWCSRCRRCNIKVMSGTDLTRDGLCHPCHSLRKCPRCSIGYQLGDKIIRCSQCSKWQHGRCENLLNDEMLEQAAINRMRCSSCRPNKNLANIGFGDGSNVVICDNVALTKAADEVLKSKFMPSLIRPSIEDYGYRNSFDQYDNEDYNPAEDVEQPFVSSRGRGRGNPGGRRGMNRIGIGGFYAKLPRHRVLALTEEAAAMQNMDEEDLKKMKKPRKPRRSQLEDAYPPAIQEAFFGIKAVEGKSLVDITVEEPSLAEYGIGRSGQQEIRGHELSTEATEQLRNDLIDNEMLDNVDLHQVIDDFDFSLFEDDGFEDSLLGDETEGDDVKDEATSFSVDPTQPSSSTSNPFDIPQNRPPSQQQQYQQQQMQPHNPYPNEANNFMSVQQGMAGPNMMQHQVAASKPARAMGKSGNSADAPERYQYSERWEEDEPLGLQATTAAVLYSNEKHQNLKMEYPVWQERVKHIQRLWRTLSAEERQEYVNRARENRTNRGNKPRPRKNNAQSTSVDSPTTHSPAPGQISRTASDIFKVPAVPGGVTPLYEQDPGVHSPVPQVVLPPKQYRITCHLTPELHQQYNQLKLKQDDLEKIVSAMDADLSKQRKQKKNLAAKKRQMIKNGHPDLPEAEQRILLNLTEAIKAMQADMENSKRDMKAHETSVREFEVRNAILRSEMEVTQQMIDQTQILNQQAAHDNARIQMIRQQQQQQQQQQQMIMQQQQRPGPPVMMQRPPGVPQPGMVGQPGQFMMQRGPLTPQQQHHMEMQRRMMPHPRKMRSSSIGRVRYDQIENPIEREVYETLDDVVWHISATIPHKDGQMLKRLLEPNTGGVGQPGPSGIPPHHMVMGPQGMVPAGMPIGPPGMQPGMHQIPTTSQPPPQTHLLVDQAVEGPPRPKKKRTVHKKAAQPYQSGGEYTKWLETLRTRFRLCQEIPKRSKEPPPRNPGAVFAIRGITEVVLKKGRKLLEGGGFGEMHLKNLDDYYTGLDRMARTLYHPELGMHDIAPNAHLPYLYSQGEPTEDEYFYDEVDKATGSRNLLTGLSKCLDQQRGVHLDHIPLCSRIGEEMKPVEPLRRMFGTESFEEDVKVELSWNVEKKEKEENEMEIDSDDKNIGIGEMVHQIKVMLGIDEGFNVNVDYTPPMSPSATTPDVGMGTALASTSSSFERDIKMEIDDGSETPTSTDGIKKEIVEQMFKCKQCSKEASTCVVRQKMEKLGLVSADATDEEKEEFASFCTRKCYYELMATSKVPLSHEEVNAAEAHVDEETFNRLKQIHSDNIVKAVSQGKAKLPCAPNVGIMEGLISPKDTRYMMDEGKKELVTMIHVSTLSNSQESRVNEAPKVPTNEWKAYSNEIADTFRKMVETHQEYVNSSKMGVPTPLYELDQRQCVLCGGRGDGETSKCGRLLSLTEYFWVHVNCALWSSEVFETPTGGLIHVDRAVIRACKVQCGFCGRPGASIKCHKLDCQYNFHVLCALETHGFFIKDRTFICRRHDQVAPEVTVQRLDALRRIYIQRDENQLLSRMFELTDGPKLCLRLGAFSFHNVGQILPDQLKTFHNSAHIFPVGYRVLRWFWSPKSHKNRMQFECWISDVENKPCFNVRSLEDEELCFAGKTATEAWTPIFEQVCLQRGAVDMLRFFGGQICGEALFGLNENVISKITESLPGVDCLYTYNFRHSNSPILELPLAENPMGCARAEPRFRTLIKHHRSTKAAASTAAGASSTNGTGAGPSGNGSNGNGNGSTNEVKSSMGRTRGVRSTLADEHAVAQVKALGLSAEYAAMVIKGLEPIQGNTQVFSAYQKMRREWKNTVSLARSKIQGLGLYAQRDISMGDFIIEYKGEVIRSEVGEVREKRYNAQNRGVYMFRIDEEWIIDATMAGGPARYVNHSCDPNCSTRILNAGSTSADKKIIITANRPIMKNEELTYDYQFELEDSTDKIPCLCGAPNCVKWMN